MIISAILSDFDTSACDELCKKLDIQNDEAVLRILVYRIAHYMVYFLLVSGLMAIMTS